MPPNANRPYVFVRGNQHDKGAQVEPHFVSIVSDEPFRNGSGRLELARAIADADNPLTARVMVNRVWQHLFGEGLARTPSDFGKRGDSPSHPELLDYLAATFVEDGWSVKKLIRRVMLSRVYRQRSGDAPDCAAVDQTNRLLWRQNRRRLDFEALRDSMLAVAGRLDGAVGGPPFALEARPAAARRSIYAYISREEPSGLMRSFRLFEPRAAHGAALADHRAAAGAVPAEQRVRRRAGAGDRRGFDGDGFRRTGRRALRVTARQRAAPRGIGGGRALHPQPSRRNGKRTAAREPLALRNRCARPRPREP